MAVSKIITDAPMEATSIVLSKPVDVNGLSSVTIQAVFTGTPTGTFAVEASIADSNWVDIVAGIPAAAGAAGSRLVEIVNLKFQLLRLKYTNASGTGTLNAHVET